MNRDELARRIKAARTWLEKAEDSYGNQSAWKGELNLMLALAEIQKLKERRAERKTDYVHHIVSLGMALFIVASAGWYWWDQQTPSTSLVSTPTPVVNAPVPSVTVAPPVVTPTPAVSIAAEAKQDPLPTVTLTNHEMQAVVRDAGKALRGKE